ncbi:hypothetical protein INQ51_17920 [Maribellus sp. CM-23]|uniref:DUF6448 family protein n=1 Tax=Maribellus sp. CM-23 TaxID=2781026 RepID=UPI001F2AD9C8|nr:DUF6448 family protein [Maribellus sp. CM-23]MCE4566203.1 hypothetical protein [Maribellus sp. CM-23]
MKAKEITPEATASKHVQNHSKVRSILSGVMVFLLMVFGSFSSTAHCDSYDGPTIKDALKALETNNVNLVLKWISKEQEQEVISLFEKTYALKSGDKEVYDIVEKHFLETLVRLHRETEGAPYTGLKSAGTTKKIVQLSDQALKNNGIDNLLEKLNTHTAKVIREKYEKVAALEKVKNESTEQGRQYVEAYVDYTHTLEALHGILEQGSAHMHQH